MDGMRFTQDMVKGTRSGQVIRLRITVVFLISHASVIITTTIGSLARYAVRGKMLSSVLV